MCAPLLAVAAVAGLQMGGAAYSANQQNQAGKETQKYYNYLADQNKIAADEARKQGIRETTAAQTEGAFEAKRLGRNVRQFAASQLAAAAANGIGGGSVTTQDLALDTFEKGKLDEMAIRYNADQKSWAAQTGADYKAWDFENQATQNRISGVQARRTASRQANATLLSGATQAIGSFATYGMYGGGGAAAKTVTAGKSFAPVYGFGASL